jgi:hypothetical protein
LARRGELEAVIGADDVGAFDMAGLMWLMKLIAEMAGTTPSGAKMAD